MKSNVKMTPELWASLEEESRRQSEARKREERLVREQGWRDEFRLPDSAQIYEQVLPDARWLDKRLPAHYGYSIVGVVVSEEEMLAEPDKERCYYIYDHWD